MIDDSTSKPLERGRGFFDYIDYQSGSLRFEGWMFISTSPFDDIAFKINGAIQVGARLVDRPDVNKVFGIPNAVRSGFRVDVTISEERLKDWIDIDIIGMVAGREVAIISTTYKLDFRVDIAEPPLRLIKHVSGSESQANYWASALTSFSEYRSAIRRYADEGQIARLLDWGCGCGRMTALFLQHANIREIYGCDIDTDAIDWCRTHVSKGHFDVIAPNPPTPYPSDYFDTIISYSVFTHLTRGAQQDWLQEMHRILRPGALMFASCHGDFATSFAASTIQSDVIREGISDCTLDANLDGVAPNGYYRSTYQSEIYTVATVRRYFRLVEYVPRAVASYQDLMILQK